MQMLEDPDKFKHLERFLDGGESKTTSRMNLPPADLKKYKELQELI